MKSNLVIVAIMGLIVTGCVSPRGFPPTHGIQNLDRVTDTLSRGAQPTQEGITALKDAGVTRIINLRNDPLRFERERCAQLGIELIEIPLSGTKAPKPDDIEKALAAIQSAPGKVFVHCQFGCDRTGTVIACYRIRSGWTNSDALREAEAYGMSELSCGMKAFIRAYNRRNWVVYDTLEGDYLTVDHSWSKLSSYTLRMTRDEAWATVVNLRHGNTTEYCDTGSVGYPIVIRHITEP
jgi:protein tyrosine phosphatase (PTP) superfamily phosphohydrolase (DUF442 family)